MEQGASYAGGDGNQIFLVGEDFDLAGARDIGEVDGASVADVSHGEFVGGNAGELREEFAGVDAEGFYARSKYNPRSLDSSYLSLWERQAPVGMTIVVMTGIGMTRICLEMVLLATTILEMSGN